MYRYTKSTQNPQLLRIPSHLGIHLATPKALKILIILWRMYALEFRYPHPGYYGITPCELLQSMHDNLLNDKKENEEFPKGNESLSLTPSEKNELINGPKNLCHVSNKQE